jgi:zinc and cadmium transporter
MALSVLMWILLVTIINGLLAFAGVLFLAISKKKLNKILIFLVSFTTGALIGGAFFHFIPEAIEEISLKTTTWLTISGFIIFMILEKTLWHHCHHGHCDEHPFTYSLLYGDALHNFVDGLIIASSFIISIPLGIVTSFLILAHELPQEIGDFGALIYGGFTKTKALTYNFLTQLTAVLGGILGYFIPTIHENAIYLMPIAAGGFLYIAIVDLVPEIIKEKKPIKIILNLMAILVGLSIMISSKIFIG